MHTFPRIGHDSAVYDPITVRHAAGHYVATARRDGVVATKRVADHPTLGATPSERAITAAWQARCAMAAKWRDAAPDGTGHLARDTYDKWTDRDQHVVCA